MLRRFLHVFESIIMFSLIMSGIDYVTDHYLPNQNKQEISTRLSTRSSTKSSTNIVQPDFESSKLSDKSPNYVPDKIVYHSQPFMGENDQHVYNHRKISVYDDTHDSSLRPAIDLALNNWNENGIVLFYLTDNRNANIKLVKKSLPDRTEGMTQQWIDSSNNYVAYSLTQLDSDQMQRYAPNVADKAKVIEHELGHAVGLDHVKKYSIMRTGQNDFDLTQDDFNRVKRLYEKKPLVA